MQFSEKGVRFGGDADDVEDTAPRSDRLHRKDTPHYKRDMKITETNKPDSVIALLRNKSQKGMITTYSFICFETA